MPPAFDPEATPSQALAAGSFRYTVEAAARGAQIGELPELADVPGGEWVVLAMYGQNWSDAEEVFDMADFTLLVDGQEIRVDSGNDWVAGLLGYSPAYGNDDAVLFAPDEGHRFVLTFLVPEGAQEIALRAGEQTFALDRTVETSPDFADVGPTPDAPQLQEATVVEVVNGEQITVKVDGRRQGVRYLGVDIPLEGDCYAAESTAANRALVAGETVYLERQSTNVDARGNWVRDVWVAADDEGGLTLVADELVGQGAAVAAISSPNTRFADWLAAAEQTAREDDAGLWGECGGFGDEVTRRRLAVPVPINVAPLQRDTPI
jgi:endonuclease YncB( thermonuclease family)